MKKHRRVSCQALRIASEIFFGLDSSIALASDILVKQDPVAYLEHKLDPSSYVDWRDFHRDYIALSLLSKWQHFDIGIDRDAVALEKFAQSERQCAETNARLVSFNRTIFPMDERLPSYIHMAKGKIERVLGDFSWDDAHLFMGFGPGASLDLPKTRGDAWYKYGLLSPSTTGDNARLAICAIKQIPQWETIVAGLTGKAIGDCLTIVDGNRVTTVPKSAKTNRVIAVEPTLNMYVQKGIGGLIRKRLKRVGVNLDSQTLNQRLAKAGSEDGSLATIDLASASDTIALGLVELLLPDDWVTAIKLCRSPVGTLPDGTKIRYQKVSSMGNGYTFELESLIFWALTSSVVSHSGDDERGVAIYGDDIVVPTASSNELVRLLEWCGFKTNSDKSFTIGPFRESCGKHYFRGHDVTPIYIKDYVDDLERKLWLANNIKRLAHIHLGWGHGCHGRLLGAYRALRSTLPRGYQQPSIPDGFGDGGLIGDFDEVTPRRLPHGIDGYRVHYMRRIYDRRRVGELPTLIKSLMSLSRRPADFRSDPGCRTCEIPLRKFRLTRVKGQVQQWVDLGPWVDL